MPETDFSDVTEVPGLAVSRVQLARTYHRYEFAREHVRGAVLELACGAGQGLAYLARAADRVVGGDRTAANIDLARVAHGARFPLLLLDACRLPFADASFDSVVLLEALYYLPDADGAVAECARVLRHDGRLVVSSVNCAWPDFGRSIHSTRYYTSREIGELLARHGFGPRLYGAFAEATGPVARARSMVRRLALRLGLVPGSLRAKALLKRFFYGPLLRQPARLDDGAASGERADPIRADDVDTRHSILYAVGVRA